MLRDMDWIQKDPLLDELLAQNLPIIVQPVTQNVDFQYRGRQN
ncbi:hypothetical protein [Paenibacillus sp. Marseille-Q7038]